MKIAATQCTRQRVNPKVLVELSHCVTETVENAELVARWNDVDVTNLLRFN